MVLIQSSSTGPCRTALTLLVLAVSLDVSHAFMVPISRAPSWPGQLSSARSCLGPLFSANNDEASNGSNDEASKPSWDNQEPNAHQTESTNNNETAVDKLQATQTTESEAADTTNNNNNKVASDSTQSTEPVTAASTTTTSQSNKASSIPSVIHRKHASTPFDNLNLVAGTTSSSSNRRLRSWTWWKGRIPNYLTYLRLLLVPVVALSFSLSPKWTPAWFALATLSDFFDGYWARKWHVTSDFGAFLDPVADKLLVSTSLIALSAQYGMVVAWPSAVIIAREVAVSALREWMAQRQLRDMVQVSWQGKVKTACTMVALFVMLCALAVSSSKDMAVSSSIRLWQTSVTLLYASAILTVTSGAAYFRAAASALMAPPRKRLHKTSYQP